MLKLLFPSVPFFSIAFSLTFLLVCSTVFSPIALADSSDRHPSFRHDDFPMHRMIAAADQETIKQRKDHFRSLSDKDKKKIKRARQRYEDLSAEEKNRLKKKWEKKTPQEKARYKKWKREKREK